MKLTVLTENVAGGEFLAEHGLSYLIEHDNSSILFDAGHSNIYIQNAKKLGIDLDQQVSKIVLSHGHWDHGNGLSYIQNKPLITHPSAFMKRFRKTDHKSLGLSFSREQVEKDFMLTTSSAPLKITNSSYFLGEIPRKNDFEAKTTTFKDENGNDDFVPDDSALAFNIDEKLVIVSGCSHSGICNICEYAREVTGTKKIHAVIGGFHLKRNNEQTKKTIQYFEKEKIKNVFPSHCTELPALAAFHKAFNTGQLKTGQTIEFQNRKQMKTYKKPP